MREKPIMAADLFCGGGGTSTGLMKACKQLKRKLKLLAINHWDVAISTHSTNHPYAEHLCTGIDNVDPRKVVPGGRLNLLVGSPECMHHSNARGGRPISDQSRASAWHILRWAEALYIENIIIENVPEFMTWGPLGADNRPLKSRRGETFLAFIAALKSLGYNVEHRILNCADYGDPTTRERLFIMARRGKRVVWPEPTHGDDPLFKKLQPWRAAKEIIDWGIEGRSIFNRKRPLAPATLARIEAGLKKFGGKNAEPFLVILRNGATTRSIDKPLPTITAHAGHVALCEPFVLGQQSCAAPRSVDDPLPTIASAGAISLIQPFLIGAGGPTGNGRPHPINKPMRTILGENRTALIEPFVMQMEHGKRSRNRSVNEPMPTVTSADGFGLVEPFIFAHQRRENSPTSVNEPIQTITATSSDFALVEPFLVKYNGTAKAQPIGEPLDTVTSKDRFGLVETDQGPMRIDIRFRMLHPHELARAMSFDDDYKFSGTRELQVKQIGNAVPVRTAEALCLAALS